MYHKDSLKKEKTARAVSVFLVSGGRQVFLAWCCAFGERSQTEKPLHFS